MRLKGPFLKWAGFRDYGRGIPKQAAERAPRSRPLWPCFRLPLPFSEQDKGTAQPGQPPAAARPPVGGITTEALERAREPVRAHPQQVAEAQGRSQPVAMHGLQKFRAEGSEWPADAHAPCPAERATPQPERGVSDRPHCGVDNRCPRKDLSS